MALATLIKEMIELVVPFLDRVPAVRAILGVGLVFFLPGFSWTLVLFSGRQINIVERIALSVGLSIAIVTLSLLALNKIMGIGITGINAVLVIVAVSALPVAVYLLRRFVSRRRGDSGEPD